MIRVLLPALLVFAPVAAFAGENAPAATGHASTALAKTHHKKHRKHGKKHHKSHATVTHHQHHRA
jgi:hypothetical protein